MSIINVVLTVLVLWLLPYLAGNGFCECLQIKKTIPKLYLLGLVIIWSFCQVITVPLVLLKAPFWTVVAILSVWNLFLAVYGLYQRRFPRLLRKKRTKEEKIIILISTILILVFLLAVFLGQHQDADDSRFVVNAVDIVRTDRMLLTDPNTGNEITTWLGELKKDVTAPWAVYLAYCGKITGLSPTIIAHLFLPVSLMMAVLGVWWMLSEEFFGKDIFHRCIFLDTLMFLHLYGYISVYNAETFVMVRLWQGKAVVAGLGIPAIFLICMWIYRYNKKSDYICLALLDFALCLMSGMGVIIGALLLGCFGLLYGIFKRKWKVTLSLWLMIIPNVIYYLIYYLLSKGVLK